jgi:high-affinity Fe2+/Pb2+ permease
MHGPFGKGQSHQWIVNKTLSYDAGQWLIGAIAVAIIGNGFYQGYRGISGKFMNKIMVMKPNFENVVRKTGIAGYIARAVVLAIVGYLLLHAAVTSNPSETKGSEQAFAFIENKFGSFLLGVVAAGLFAYGLFMFIKARYQQLNMRA